MQLSANAGVQVSASSGDCRRVRAQVSTSAGERE